jgi:glycosyltransferase involved in cell wall biosynthesis
MKVSTIIRTFNRAHIIGDALESALAQTYRDLEVIVVDDGSTDNTSSVVHGFRDKRVRLIRHGYNMGVAAAANTGVAAATGEAIALLDSDDLWKPDKTERQVEFLRRHPAVSAVFSDVEVVDGATVIPSTMGYMRSFPKLIDRRQKGQEFVLTGRQMYLCLLEEAPIKTNALLVRREIFAAVGAFDVSARSGEDWEFFLRLSRAASFGYIDLPLAVQRRSPDSIYDKFRLHDKLFLFNVSVQEKKGLRGDPEAIRAVNRGLSQHTSNLGFLYRESGQRRKSIATYLRGFKETHDPAILARAASVWMPDSLRHFIKRAVNRQQTI